MEKNDLRILFMGTPEISAYVLKALLEDKYNVVGVVAQPDRPVGRKGDLEKVPTKIVAEEYHIPVFQPVKIRNDFNFIKDLSPDIIITLAYGQIVSEDILNIPPLGCLNLHGSLLPKYRGAAPIQYALINNEKETGMSLMQMTKKMDAGKVYATAKINIMEDDNSTSLFKKMGELAKNLLLENLPLYVEGKLDGVEQDETLVTFSPSIKPEQEKIDLSLSAQEIYGWIRGLSDLPGAYLLLNNQKFKIYKAKIVNIDSSGQIGEIIQANKQGLVLQVKDGQLLLEEVQKEGKKRMDYRSFINGNQNILGQILK